MVHADKEKIKSHDKKQEEKDSTSDIRENVNFLSLKKVYINHRRFSPASSLSVSPYKAPKDWSTCLGNSSILISTIKRSFSRLPSSFKFGNSPAKIISETCPSPFKTE